jgi:hypothetical protein
VIVQTDPVKDRITAPRAIACMSLYDVNQLLVAGASMMAGGAAGPTRLFRKCPRILEARVQISFPAGHCKLPQHSQVTRSDLRLPALWPGRA